MEKPFFPRRKPTRLGQIDARLARKDAGLGPRTNSRAAKNWRSARLVASYFPVRKLKQPLAIRILICFTALASAGMYLSILLAILDIGPHMMGGERVTRTEWLHIAAPLVAAIGILMALICYSLASRKQWSRHLVITMFTLIIVYASILGALNLIRHTIMWRAIIDATIFGGLSTWYFYFKPNVAEYFRELARQ